MKYKEQDFTLELKEKIQCMEKEIERVTFKLYKDYSHLYIEKNMKLDMRFEREKENPFEMGYYSSVSIAVLDAEGEMIEFYTIPIWKCENIFLGMPIQLRIFGSKKIGELVDESCCEIEEELKEQLEEYLE
ncbi:hypothetical protein FT637_03440 [Bacillus cereus]|uniref:hypothetical protein n=1 Tax=Bacillus cereus TaxID=1396 RepID=UPI0018798667|nr:hypothetical protein [Bacillus cereus]MBE7102120.1 hypothetical protein [Bacillus cereus]